MRGIAVVSNAVAPAAGAGRARSATDAVSGLSLNRLDFPSYSDDELLTHFSTFTQYDLDTMARNASRPMCGEREAYNSRRAQASRRRPTAQTALAARRGTRRRARRPG